jgi:hypothetical protein
MMNKAIGLILLSCACLPACGDDDEAPSDETAALEIEGAWESDFDTEVIDGDSWSVDFGAGDGPATSEIIEFSNDDNSAVLLDDMGKYGRNVWTEIADDSFYYCIVSYGQESAADAVAQSEPADDTDPATDGCGTGNFPWTMLTRQ